jgi:hypothetical protein
MICVEYSYRLKKYLFLVFSERLAISRKLQATHTIQVGKHEEV